MYIVTLCCDLFPTLCNVVFCVSIASPCVFGRTVWSWHIIPYFSFCIVVPFVSWCFGLSKAFMYRFISQCFLFYPVHRDALCDLFPTPYTVVFCISFAYSCVFAATFWRWYIFYNPTLCIVVVCSFESNYVPLYSTMFSILSCTSWWSLGLVSYSLYCGILYFICIFLRVCCNLLKMIYLL